MPPRHFARPRPPNSEDDDLLSKISQPGREHQPQTEFERAKLRQALAEKQRENETRAVLKSFTESLGAVDEVAVSLTDKPDLQLADRQDKKRHSTFLDPNILRARKRQLYHERLDRSDSDEEIQPPEAISEGQPSKSVIQVDCNGDIRTLYVKGIPPYSSTKEAIREIFASSGKVSNIHLLPLHARIRGHAAYVTFDTVSEAMKAKHDFDGIYMGSGYRLGILFPTKDDDLNLSADKQHERFLFSTQQAGSEISGLPFNAQPTVDDPSFGTAQGMPELIVRVQYPSSISELRLVHAVIEQVTKHGQEFEALIKKKEENNPKFDFLFDSSLPLHAYYRWKLYSLANGQDIDEWPLNDSQDSKDGRKFFVMSDNPNIGWISPPRLPGIEDELAILDQEYVEDEESPDQEVLLAKPNSLQEKLGFLGPLASKHLDLLLEHTTSRRGSIANIMAFAIKNANAAGEVAERICTSVLSSNCHIQTRMIRLWSISDILYNAGQSFTSQQMSGLLSLTGGSQGIDVGSIWRYRSIFETLLKGSVFPGLCGILEKLESRMKRENFKRQVLALLSLWESWSVFTPNTVGDLENILLGTNEDSGKEHKDSNGSQSSHRKGWKTVAHEDTTVTDPLSTDIDGQPFTDEDVRYYLELPSPQELSGHESPSHKDQSPDKKEECSKPTFGGKFKISFKKP